MKKLSYLVIVVGLMLSLSACGGSSDNKTKKEETITANDIINDYKKVMASNKSFNFDGNVNITISGGMELKCNFTTSNYNNKSSGKMEVKSNIGNEVTTNIAEYYMDDNEYYQRQDSDDWVKSTVTDKVGIVKSINTFIDKYTFENNVEKSGDNYILTQVIKSNEFKYILGGTGDFETLDDMDVTLKYVFDSVTKLPVGFEVLNFDYENDIQGINSRISIYMKGEWNNWGDIKDDDIIKPEVNTETVIPFDDKAYNRNNGTIIFGDKNITFPIKRSIFEDNGWTLYTVQGGVNEYRNDAFPDIEIGLYSNIHSNIDEVNFIKIWFNRIGDIYYQDFKMFGLELGMTEDNVLDILGETDYRGDMWIEYHDVFVGDCRCTLNVHFELSDDNEYIVDELTCILKS